MAICHWATDEPSFLRWPLRRNFRFNLIKNTEFRRSLEKCQGWTVDSQDFFNCFPRDNQIIRSVENPITRRKKPSNNLLEEKWSRLTKIRLNQMDDADFFRAGYSGLEGKTRTPTLAHTPIWTSFSNLGIELLRRHCSWRWWCLVCEALFGFQPTPCPYL